jgi:predicted acyltransferase
MTLMVFVNEFWKVLNVPHWMEHTATLEDGMGLSDIVFPMFLFAMGLSIPYALERRQEKGYSTESTLGHIISRTFALLVMGVFICNQESREMAGNRGLWVLLMVIGFFLTWNQYPKDWKPARWCRLAGVLLLTGLALYYRTPDGNHLQSLWWGILGLIGWTYLFCSLAYLLCRERKWVLPLIWLGICLVNLSVMRMRGGSQLIGPNVLADLARALQLGTGSCAIMALGGVMLTLADGQLQKETAGKRLGLAFAASAVLLVLGIAAHTGWIVSKNLGTLPWCLFVLAISVALYAVLRYMERRGWTGWFKPLSVAGTATLTVYMIPYLFVVLWVFVEPTIAPWLTGWVGVAKCALMAAVYLACAWGLTKAGIKLKI